MLEELVKVVKQTDSGFGVDAQVILYLHFSLSLSLQFGGTALCSLTSFLVDLRIVFIIFSAVFANLLGHNSNFQESLHVRVEN